MSNEEKEALEILKLYFGDNPTLNITKYVNIVLNLIKKQQKEIEELKQKEKQAYIDGTNVADELCNKKWEGKIKAKIEEYLEYDKKYKRYMKDGSECFTMEYYYAKMLQSLLEKE